MTFTRQVRVESPSMLRLLCLCQGLLLATLFFVVPVHAQEIRVPELDQVVNIEIEASQFQQTLEALSGQAGLNIVYHGAPPKTKRDILITAVPLHEAIERVLSIYAVPNHLAISTFDGKVLKQIDIYGLSSISAVSPTAAKPPVTTDDGENPLTEEQIDQMADESARMESEMEGDARPLKPEQTLRLQEQNTLVEDNEIGFNAKPLTPEQLEKAKAHSQLIESEELRDQSFSPSQLQKIRENSALMQREADQDSQPLTIEQRNMLQRQQGKN